MSQYLGVWSTVSRRFVFGIKAINKKEAQRQLRNKVGFYESLRYRWRIKLINNEVERKGKK